jgi:hypothetical protein
VERAERDILLIFIGESLPHRAKLFARQTNKLIEVALPERLHSRVIPVLELREPTGNRPFVRSEHGIGPYA